MYKLNILLIGSGGREHAIADALSRSDSTVELYAAPGNVGISKLATISDIDISAFDSVIDFCQSKDIQLVVVGPEQPLADGIADALRVAGIAVFGPSAAAARLESSKVFSKSFMLKHNVPTARHATFSSGELEFAAAYIQDHPLPIVLKADGLAAGKGVIIAEDRATAFEALGEIFAGKFGSAGANVVIEEYLAGEEASIFAISDGKDFVTLAPSQDHKRLLEGDKGPNTGGMGAYAPAPIVSETILEKVKTRIILPVIKAAASEGMPYIGCLYAGIMIVGGEPYVIEFNVRFGDPETQVVLPLFQGDFAALLFSAATGNLDKSTIRSIDHASAACVILASEGYPGRYGKGYEISGIEEAENIGSKVFYAGVRESEGKILSAGGRVLGVTTVNHNLKAAIDVTYKAVDMINFTGKTYRRDIGHRALKNKNS